MQKIYPYARLKRKPQHNLNIEMIQMYFLMSEIYLEINNEDRIRKIQLPDIKQYIFLVIQGANRK